MLRKFAYFSPTQATVECEFIFSRAVSLVKVVE